MSHPTPTPPAALASPAAPTPPTTPGASGTSASPAATPAAPSAWAPSSATVTTASATIVAVRGDGTTGTSRIMARLRSWRWPAAGLGAALLAGAILVSLATEQSTVPFAPDNPSPAGGMALAQVLEQQGVEIVYTTSVAEAVGASGPGSTLLIANDYGMPDDDVASLLETGSNIVLVAPGPALLAAATTEVRHAGATPTGAAHPAQCLDPDAQAAGSITSSGAGFRRAVGPESGALPWSPTADLCFSDPAEATSPSAHYAVFLLDSAARMQVETGRLNAAEPSGASFARALDDDTPLTNVSVTDVGNAALGLRMLGQSERLVWLLPERPQAMSTGGGLMAMLPPWTAAVGAQLLLLALVTALWRGRRLGPLATEGLPVVVQASETTRGRGRLYRRSRSHGHAGAALRARTTDRMATRLGVPRSAGADAVIDAVSRASHRPAQQVGALLYGPPPASDVELTRLATDLDQLESEVHRA